MIGFNFWSKLMAENAQNGNRKLFAHILSLITSVVVLGILAYMSEPFTINASSVVWSVFAGIAVLGMVFYAANALEHFADAYKERGLPSLRDVINKKDKDKDKDNIK